MPQRFDLGRALLAIGSILLLVSLFAQWYDTGPTGWEVFEAVDLLLAALALAGLAAAARPDVMPPAAGWAIPGTALAVVAVQLVNPPPAAADAGPSTGAWLALAGAVVMAAGAALSLARVSVTVQVRERDLRRRVPAVDRRAERDAAPAAPAAAPDAGSRVSLLDDPDRTQPFRAPVAEDEPGAPEAR